MISVLRAQGPLTDDKQKLLQQLAKLLHISDERHRCEIRRVANDQNLAAIAEHVHGANTGIDWLIESRRTIPLLSRLKARTAFTTLNNSLSLAISASTSNIRPNDCVIPEKSEDSTSLSAETESQPEAKIEEDLSIDKKLYNHKNIENTQVVQEDSSLGKNKTIDDKVVEEPNVELKLSKKRKSPSPLPSVPPNKVIVLSDSSSHTSRSLENRQESQLLHQNITFPITPDEISDFKESTKVSGHLNKCVTVTPKKHVVTIKTSTNNTNKSKMVVSTIQNKNTKVVSSSGVLNVSLNKAQTENENTQSTQNINSSHLLKHAVAGTIVSSGPGPPQLKQASAMLTYKKLPSEQISYSHQSAAKPNVTINSKKLVNMPQYSNTKLSANVIVIQKDAKGVTLSHAGKEVLGKVIMGRKNLCITSQHNTNSVNVQSNHIPINNGDRTKTVLPMTTNSSQKTESIKTYIQKEDVSDKDEVDSQSFNSLNFNSSTTVAQSINSCLPKRDAIIIDWKSSLKTDPAIAFAVEEQHKKNKDVNASTNSKIVNLLNTSLENKEILVEAKHLSGTEDNAEDSNREENLEEILCSATLKSADMSLGNSQYDDSCVLEESSRSIVEHNDS
ncbi:BRCA2-interacting transcriptional repressor EMSY isoform X2 [Pseudomyrmex gracilis]|nr:BRCA2-interacting transcriptional repressor EMSY isoform X2 [Pseudomyrmex gracilis]